VQAEDLDVVAHVPDRGHLLGPGRARDRVHEARPAEAATEDDYAHAILAIVPFKVLDGAKSRLAAFLPADERARLALEMLDRVLAACEGSPAITRTLLVTPNPESARASVETLVDAGTGHADAIRQALAHPRAADGALVVMADCPLVTAEALDELAEAACPVALAPADDGGMNALALRAPDLFTPAFGLPDAAAATIARARAAGIEPEVRHDPRLALDVDRPEDLAQL
jgi:2-phospho-L-lactate guanylyltransferase